MNSSSDPQPHDAEALRDAAELALLGGVVTSVIEAEKAIAALQALKVQLLASGAALAQEQLSRVATTASREREMPLRAIAAEFGAALRCSDRVIQHQLDEALTVATRFTATLEALSAGRIGLAHVRVIVDAGAAIEDDEARGAYEQASLAVAERESAGRCKPIVALLAQRFHPVPLDERHQVAAQTRRVWVKDLENEMAELGAIIPAGLAYAGLDRLSQYARSSIRGRNATDADPAADSPAADEKPADLRTTDQLRADVLVDLLLTGHATAEASAASIPEGEAIIARVQVTVPADSLTAGSPEGAESAEPAVLAGHGPTGNAFARQAASCAPAWNRLFIDSSTGAVVAVDRYRPSDEQRRLLRVRDEHCRFPGCRMSVWQCDVDHTRDAAHGGPTSVCNLAHLCRRHHVLKHRSAWTVEQKPGGVLVWTSPLGRVYPDIPARTVAFVSDPPPF